MEWLTVILERFAGLFSKRKRDRELDEELENHLDALTRANIRRGLDPEQARHAARREFGGIEQTKETYREQRGLPFLDTLLQDTRYAVRLLRNNVAFTVVAVLTLALGIGSTTAVFSVVDRILFRSLPYPSDDRLVSFGLRAPIEPQEFMLAPDYFEWRSQQSVFESITSMTPGAADCDLTEGHPARLSCALVEASFLPTFGIQPVLGRNFSPDEDRPEAPRVALITYGLWRTRFAGDPAIVGRSMSLDGRPTTIVGILPRDFEMPTLTPADVVIPQALDGSALRRDGPPSVLRAFARLKPGVSLVQSTAALQPLLDKSMQFVPPQFRKEVHLTVQSLRDRQIQDVRRASWILFGSVLAVLLVACTNMANLLVARASYRQREQAIRSALGARRSRLIRQGLTESVLLSLLGAAAGCLLAYLFLRLFVGLAPDGIPHLEQASLDSRVLLFTFAVSILSGVLFGLAPTLGRLRPELLTGHPAGAPASPLVGQSLVAAQIAVSLVLIAGAALLLRSLWNLQSTALGMDTQNAVIARIDLGPSRYPDAPRQLAFFAALEARLQRIPGVSSLALADSIPPSGRTRATIFSVMEIPGRPRLAEGTGGMVDWRAVTPGYFSALHIPILRGRAFQRSDGPAGANTVILNETLAQALFPNEDPLGKILRLRPESPWRSVVGIAADVKNNGIAAPSDPEYYIPWTDDEASFRTGYAILRTPLSAATVAAWMRTETAALDPALPVDISTLGQRVRRLAQRPRFNAVLLTIFAATAVVLATIGTYGVVAFCVAQRTQEIGIRVALGATRHSIAGLVLRSVARATLAGIALGLLGAWWCVRLLESLLFNVSPRDPLPFGAALLTLVLASFLAAWIPARRATRIDPRTALRYE